MSVCGIRLRRWVLGRGRTWLLYVVVGLWTGAWHYYPTQVLGGLTRWKRKMTQDMIAEYSVAAATVFQASLGFVAAAAAGALVLFCGPEAHGSGLAQTIAFLAEIDALNERAAARTSGSRAHAATFEVKTVVVKIVALALAVFSGLALGREGPAVAIGAALGWNVSRLVRQELVEDPTDSGAAERIDAACEGGLVHTLVTAGGAAGFAAVFNAPLGGILYMLEEVALPTGWSARATRTSFIAATVAVLTVKTLIHFSTLETVDRYHSIVIGMGPVDGLGWQFADLIPFMVVGATAGFGSSVCSAAGYWINVKRKDVGWLARSRLNRVLEVALVAALSSACWMTLPLLARHVTPEDECLPLPADYHKLQFHEDDDARGHGDRYDYGVHADDGLFFGGGGRRRLTGGMDVAVKVYVRYTCPKRHYSPIASLTLADAEGAMSNLFARGPDRFGQFPLLLYIFAYAALFVLNLGSVVPAGTFVPMMLYGACIGRSVGELVSSLSPDSIAISDPGVYAALGAACALAGFTRCTVAVLATTVEVTGDIAIVAPTMLSLSVARWAAKHVTHEGYTHLLVSELVRAKAAFFADSAFADPPDRDHVRRLTSVELLLHRSDHDATDSPSPRRKQPPRRIRSPCQRTDGSASLDDGDDAITLGGDHGGTPGHHHHHHHHHQQQQHHHHHALETSDDDALSPFV